MMDKIAEFEKSVAEAALPNKHHTEKTKRLADLGFSQLASNMVKKKAEDSAEDLITSVYPRTYHAELRKALGVPKLQRSLLWLKPVNLYLYLTLVSSAVFAIGAAVALGEMALAAMLGVYITPQAWSLWGASQYALASICAFALPFALAGKYRGLLMEKVSADIEFYDLEAYYKDVPDRVLDALEEAQKSKVFSKFKIVEPVINIDQRVQRQTDPILVGIRKQEHNRDQRYYVVAIWDLDNPVQINTLTGMK